VLIGRDAETAVIDGLVAAAREGRSGVLLLRGDAGVGKSTLLEYAAERAQGFSILRGAGVETESELAYAALHQILRPLFDRIDQLPEPQAVALRAAFALSLEPVDERFHVLLGALGLVSEAAEVNPVLCLIDDAQWLDQASTDALLFAARRLVAERLVMLFAARNDPLRPFVAPGIPVLEVSALTSHDARALLTSKLRADAAPDVVDWLLESAHGIPLALIELPLVLSEGQLAGREPLGGGLTRATSVEQAYLERVHRLPAEVRTLLLIAAAEETGDRHTIGVAATGLGLDVEMLALAEEQGLVRVDPGRVEFRHPLVRSAIYNGAGFADRERAHRALASTLADERDVDRRAWHRAAATATRDDGVANELASTAERARRRGGYVAAAAALERAAELTAEDSLRAHRLTAAADAAWLAGHPLQAGALVDRAELISHTEEVDAQAKRLRGLVELRCGIPATAFALLLEAARKIGPADPTAAIEVLAEARDAAAFSGDVQGMILLGREVDELASEGNGALVCVLSGLRHLLEEELEHGASLLREAIDLAAALDDPRHLAWTWPATLYLGAHADGEQIAARAVAHARRAGTLGILPLALERLAFSQFWCGAPAAAKANAAEAVQLAQDIGQDEVAANAYGTLALLAAVEGREEECRSAVSELQKMAIPRRLALFFSSSEWALALLELGLGRAADALSRLNSLTDKKLGNFHPAVVFWSAPDLIESAARAGNHERAREALKSYESWALASNIPRVLSTLARCKGLLAEGPEAETHFQQAVDLPIANHPFDQARAEFLFGEFLRRERRRIDAREHLRTAVEIFGRLGAEPWEERARRELRATGEKARRRDPSTLAQLTPQELQITRLVAAGSSNKEVAAELFLSPRTIDYHLHKVFLKLGIASRAELIKRGVSDVSYPSEAALPA
jgi:DNA-binding CsgD family transcriptional regulator